MTEITSAVSNQTYDEGQIVNVDSGGYLDQSTFSNGSEEVVFAGGNSDENVLSGTDEIVSSGGASINDTLNGGVIRIASGGTASSLTATDNSIVQNYGTITDNLFIAGTIDNFGNLDTNIFVDGSTTLVMEEGSTFTGTAYSYTQDPSTVEIVGVLGSGNVISNFDNQYQAFSNLDVNTDISTPLRIEGEQSITNISNAGTIVLSSGDSLGVHSLTGSGSVVISSGGYLTIGNQDTNAISFAGSGGILDIDEGADVQGPISGFGAGDAIYLDLSLSPGETVSVTSNLIEVPNGASSIDLQLGTPVGGTVQAINDGGFLELTVVGISASLTSDTGSSSSDGITSDDALSGVGVAGDTVHFAEGATPIGSALVSSGGTWSFTPTGLADGAHVITATDGANSTSVGFTLVTSAPTPGFSMTPATDTGVSQTDGITSSTTPAFSGTVAANYDGVSTNGDAVTLFDGGSIVGTAMVEDGGWSSGDVATLSSGPQTISAVLTDPAGNTASATLGIDIEPNAPATTFTGAALASASDTGFSDADGITNITTPALVGSGAIAGDMIAVYDGGSTGTSAAVLLGAATVSADGTWSISSTPLLSSGVHVLSTIETSIAGVSSDPVTTSININETIPSPTVSLSLESHTGVANQNITDLTQPVISGGGHSGDLITLYDYGQEIGVAVVEDGRWSIMPKAPLLDGTHQFTVIEENVAGNVGKTYMSLTVDTSTPAAPAAPMLATIADSGVKGDDITNLVRPMLTGSGATPGTVMTVYDGATVLGSATVSNSGTWSVTPANALSGGVHAITATDTSLSGEVSSQSAPLSLTIDTAVPSPTLVLDPSSDTGVIGDNETDQTNPTFSGSGGVGDEVLLRINGVTVASATVTSAGTWSITDPSSLVDGSYSVKVYDYNVAGTVGSASTKITVDTTVPAAPAAPVLAATDDSGIVGDDITNVVMPTFSGSGATIGDTISLLDGGVVIGSATVDPDGDWSVMPMSALSVGSHTLTLTDTSVAGEISVASAPTPLTVVPMTIGLTSASDSNIPGDTITNDNTPVVSGIGVIGDTITLSDGGNIVGSMVVTAPDGSWAITTSVLGEGPQTLSATETNGDSVVQATSPVMSLTIDTIAPVAPHDLIVAASSDSGISQTDGITNVAMPVISGLGEAGDTILLSDQYGVIGSGTIDGDGTWSVTPTSALLDGQYQVTATETDVAGNISNVSSALNVTIETTTPLAPSGLVLTSASDSGIQNDDITNVTTPTITGSGTVGDIVTLYAGKAAVGSALVDGDGNWSVTTTPLSGGAYTVTATESDLAGNVSAASAPMFVDIDTFTPSTPTLADTSTTSSPSSPVIGGNAPLAVSVVLYVDGTQMTSVYTQQSGAWTMVVPTLGVGPHVLTVMSVDAAGNQSAMSSPLTVTVAQNGSYTVANSSGTNVRVYDATGSLSAINTMDSSGRLIESVGATQAVREVYDSAGTLIGSVTEASSGPTSTPVFNVTVGTQSATIVTGTGGSLVSLSSETNTVTANGPDTISAGAGTTVIHGDGPSLSVAGGSGHLTVNAAAGPLTVTGGTGSSTVQGGAGAASIGGGSAGHNLLQAGSGNTTLMGGGSGDTLVGGSGSDTIVMRANSTAYSGSGNASIFGATGGTVVGGSGHDIMVSGGGNEAFSAGTGSTTIFGGSGSDSMTGGASGQTLMVGGSGDEQFVGGAGTTTVFGGNGPNTFFSGKGQMTIMEGNGSNTAEIGSGTTMVYGGLGRDVYDIVNGSAGGAAVVAGFKVGTDQIGLYGYDMSTTHTQVIGGNTVLSLSDGTNITLLGVTDLPKSAIS